MPVLERFHRWVERLRRWVDWKTIAALAAVILVLLVGVEVVHSVEGDNSRNAQVNSLIKELRDSNAALDAAQRQSETNGQLIAGNTAQIAQDRQIILDLLQQNVSLRDQLLQHGIKPSGPDPFSVTGGSSPSSRITIVPAPAPTPSPTVGPSPSPSSSPAPPKSNGGPVPGVSACVGQLCVTIPPLLGGG